MVSGEFGAPMLDALRHSFVTMPREGWVASERVVLGMKLYPLLPADLQRHVQSDLRIVLASTPLATPLVEAYPADLALRRAAASALLAVPPELLDRFVTLIHESKAYSKTLKTN